MEILSVITLVTALLVSTNDTVEQQPTEAAKGKYSLVLYRLSTLNQIKFVEERMHNLTKEECNAANNNPEFADFNKGSKRYIHF